MFVDNVKIYAEAGNGGDGCVNFRREKFIEHGGPDGGDGGSGGDVIFEVSNNTHHLSNLLYKPKVKAINGDKGSRRRRTGLSGKDLIIQVPPGTLIHKKRETVNEEIISEVKNESSLLDDAKSEYVTVADLTDEYQQYVLLKGGKGGKGNWRFKSSTNRTPMESTPGALGEKGNFKIELRNIANAGLVGYPNAGKSTLLGAISNSKPKVASFPFTTLQPSIGVMETEDFSKVTVADIPGIIEGAHNNKGLGHQFLRHIMRCQLLLFVVDTAGSEGRSPIDDIEKLRTEISLYDKILAQQDWIIIANKTDLDEAKENIELLQDRYPKIKIIPISAQKGEGMDSFKSYLTNYFSKKN